MARFGQFLRYSVPREEIAPITINADAVTVVTRNLSGHAVVHLVDDGCWELEESYERVSLWLMMRPG